jgi:hypothetical protein
MKVTITYTDGSSLTKEEIVRQAIHNYGKAARIEVLPDSDNAHDLIYLGIQQIVTHQQLSLLFDKGLDYSTNLRKLRAEALYKLSEILDTVIIDNESKVT